MIPNKKDTLAEVAAESRAKVRKAIETCTFYAADFDDDTGVHDIKAIATQFGIAQPGDTRHPPPPEPHDTRILVIDDDPDIAEALYDILTGEDYSVWRAPNGVQAFEVLASMLPRENGPRVDCILVDLMMPHLDGVGFKRILSTFSEYRHVPVIVITGRATAALHEGHFMLKPLDLDTMLVTIRERIAESRARQNMTQP